MPKMLKPREAAAYLGIGYEKLIDLIHSREVPACKVGGVWRIPQDALQKCIQEKLSAHNGAVA
jgi:excisionase family DNA binding protein